MRRVAMLVGAAAVVLLTAGLVAQTKPNFAGKWAQVVDPSAPAPAGRGGRGGGGMGGLGAAFTATQDEKTLTVTRMLQQTEIKMVYNLDGSDSKNTLSFGGQSVDQISKVKWDAAKLVITTTTNFGGNTNESTQAWSMDATGNLVIETTTNFGGNGPTTAKTTYKKG